MPLFSFEGKTPKIHPTAFIAPTASIIGDVTVEENASVWYGTVIRADFSPIVIRRGANVQDGSVIHVTPAGGTEVGPGATIGARSMIAAGSLVTPGTDIPEGVLAMGAPCKVRGPLAGTPAERWVQMNPAGYQALAQRHRAGARPI
jgi:carbonic anhydrase/acetyltransferase-like protein (isoleucine patch superfamily)